MIWFEGNGESKPVGYEEVLDLFINAVHHARDTVLAKPELDAFEDANQRDKYVANNVIQEVFNIISGNDPDCPGFTMIPQVGHEEHMIAVEAGANYIPYDNGTDNYVPIDISEQLADYFNQVNS